MVRLPETRPKRRLNENGRHPNYTAGAKGIFEFIRFDQSKPGIVKKLGPITNDAIGGLIVGVSSNMYTRALSQKMKSP